MVVTSSGLNLTAAWRLVLSEIRAESDIPDIIRWQDYDHTSNAWLAQLAGSLDDGSYKPSVPRIVEMPKDAFMVRPIALLSHTDRVVYEALVASIGPHIDRVLPDAVYSARLGAQGIRSLDTRSSILQWVRFQRAGRDLYNTYGYAFAITTDLASYFETIDLGVLLKDLLALPGVDRNHHQLLSSFLHHLERSSDVWGLPQGPDASRILGNFYLLPADRSILREADAVVHIRYQDDIKLFSNDPGRLRVALQQLIRVLRTRHLNLSVHKTRMLEGKEILEEFEDARKDAIQYNMRIGSHQSLDEITKLFDDAVRSRPVSTRDVRFAVTRLTELKSPHAVNWILDHLGEVPYLAQQLVNYLSGFMESATTIQERVRQYLIDSAKNIYPFAEIHLMRLLGRTPHLSDATHSCVWRIARDQNKDALVRQHAARCLGRHTRAGDVPLLESLFNVTDLPIMQRALLIAMYEASSRADAAKLGTIEATHPNLSTTCKYLRTNPKLLHP